MPQFFSNLLRSMGGPRGTDMQLLCRQLLSQRGEASQTVLAQRIFAQYQAMSTARKLEFFEMLAAEFGPDQDAIQKAMEAYQALPTPECAAALSAAAEAPRQELFRRLNTAPSGPENLVNLRPDLLLLVSNPPVLALQHPAHEHW